MKQPQGQQGRKAGSQSLPGPQARGQRQGGHKHNSAAKPGGQWGTHRGANQDSSGVRMDPEGLKGGAAPYQSQPVPRMTQPNSQPRRWLVCSSGTFQPFSHTRFH